MAVLCATFMMDTANREILHSLAKAIGLSAPNPHRLPSTVARDDEPLLVAAAKSGDATAFEELVRRYERKIFRLTMNITRNREDAEDAMQDAFMKAYTHLNNFQENSRFYTWLVRIAANEALMRLRKRRPNQFSLDEPLEGDDDLMPREIEDWGPSPEQRYAQSEMQEILNKVRHRTALYRGDCGCHRDLRARGEIEAPARATEIAGKIGPLSSQG